jgi:hypothetical protein
MADIAVVFHWPPTVMDPMELDELMDWWQAAVKRWSRSEDDED